MAKDPKTIHLQIERLQKRGMLFRDIASAEHFLINVSYYRLEGYWWEMQEDKEKHSFKENIYFDDIIELYNFDRNFRLLVFNAIERIEIALRTKLTYHMSLAYGALWYLDSALFSSEKNHDIQINKIQENLDDSSEIFIKKHYLKHPDEDPESWKALEVITLNTLSKIYKNIKNVLPPKSKVTNELGLNSPKDLASWLMAINFIRNIIAHHSRLWNRTIITRYKWPKTTPFPILDYTPDELRRRKIFPILCGIIYMNDRISPGHHIKNELFDLIEKYPSVKLYRMGFPPNWKEQPIFKT